MILVGFHTQFAIFTCTATSQQSLQSYMQIYCRAWKCEILSLKTLKVVVVDSLYWRTRRGKKCTHHQYSDMSKKESISRLLVMHACANCLHLCLAMMSYVMLVHYNFASCVCIQEDFLRSLVHKHYANT